MMTEREKYEIEMKELVEEIASAQLCLKTETNFHERFLLEGNLPANIARLDELKKMTTRLN